MTAVNEGNAMVLLVVNGCYLLSRLGEQFSVRGDLAFLFADGLEEVFPCLPGIALLAAAHRIPCGRGHGAEALIENVLALEMSVENGFGFAWT